MKIKFSTKNKSEFKKMNIDIIYLFGSAAQGFSGKLSDIDIGIVFSSPEKIKNTLPLYKKLYKLFSRILPMEKEIDIVFLQFTPLNLQFNAVSYGRILYESSKKRQFDYKEKVLKKYVDFRYYFNLAEKHLLERI